MPPICCQDRTSPHSMWLLVSQHSPSRDLNMTPFPSGSEESPLCSLTIPKIITSSWSARTFILLCCLFRGWMILQQGFRSSCFHTVNTCPCRSMPGPHVVPPGLETNIFQLAQTRARSWPALCQFHRPIFGRWAFFWSRSCTNTMCFCNIEAATAVSSYCVLSFRTEYHKKKKTLIDYWFAPIAFLPGVLWQCIWGLVSLPQ